MRLVMSLCFSVLMAIPVICRAQVPQMTRARQQVIIEKTLDHISANYVYSDRAKAVKDAVHENVRAGKYDALTQPDTFLDALNRDMQTAANDKHLRVIHNPRMAAQLRKEAAGVADAAPEFLAMLKRENLRLRRAESLDGNVGYFKFDNFVELRYVKDAFIGAMNMLHASAALILDFTDNGGGSSETADLLLSYFLPEGTRISESWNRVTNQTTVSTVTRSPDVKPLLDIPVYILVSDRTASAAEAVAYALQQAKRAVVVGTRTKGMANAGQHFLIDDALYVMVPTIIVRNAVSGTNWEGVGVIPDVDAPPGRALEVAMAHALNRLADREPSEGEKRRLRFMEKGYAAAVSPEPIPVGLFEACIGHYRQGQKVVQIVRQEDGLFFVNGDRGRRMTYLRNRTFAVEGRRDYRVQFHIEEGRPKRLDVLWFDDTADAYLRTR